MSEQNQAEAPQEELNEILAARLEKLDAMREKGQAFPNDFRPDALAEEIHRLYQDKQHDDLEADPIRVRIAGRIMTRRIMGKASFVHIQDMSGKIQLYLRRGKQLDISTL